MEVDYIIIGQGICGSFLSWNLIKAGKKVIVIDEPQQYSASKVASGIINPVTGRRIVKTWMIDELLLFAWNAYLEIGKEINAEIIQQCSVLDFHASPQMKEAFEKRLNEEKQYLHTISNDEFWKKYFRFNYGIGEISPCFLIDLNTLLNKWREKLNYLKALLETRFNWKDCVVENNYINYKNITAQKIIFCEGVNGFENPYFKMLPFVRTKGKTTLVDISGLPRTNIYHQSTSVVRSENDFF
ncbi:MAG: FAD-dependent oxidoreductase, partial [Chitinophagaceae bacterium]